MPSHVAQSALCGGYNATHRRAKARYQSQFPRQGEVGVTVGAYCFEREYLRAVVPGVQT